MDSSRSLPNVEIDMDNLARSIGASQPRKVSTTMELDKSQPPTPDGSGLPANFQIVAPHLYRSSHPSFPHFQCLAELRLRTIVTLVPEPLDDAYSEFISTNGIVHHQIPIIANKSADTFTDAGTIHQVLGLIFDPTNYPMLIHCNKGKHRTGCIIACFRRVCGWTTDAAIEEYIKYSTPKDRPLDKVFIEKYDETVLKPEALECDYVRAVYTSPNSKSSCYTNLTLGEETSDDESNPNQEYEETAREVHAAAMESFHRWNPNR